MTDRFAGLPYPLSKDAGGIMHKQRGTDQIKSDLLILLLTNPGERIMLPTFGTPLKRLIFEPNDRVIEQQAVSLIAASLAAWEPRVVIEQLEVTSNAPRNRLSELDDLTNQPHVLLIIIRFFDPENIQEVDELRLEVPLPG